MDTEKTIQRISSLNHWIKKMRYRFIGIMFLGGSLFAIVGLLRILMLNETEPAHPIADYSVEYAIAAPIFFLLSRFAFAQAREK